jgi:putative acetyltransferase
MPRETAWISLTKIRALGIDRIEAGAGWAACVLIAQQGARPASLIADTPWENISSHRDARRVRGGRPVPEIRLEIREDDLSGDQTLELLRLHLQGMQSSSPPGSVFALDLSGLKAAGVSVWTAWIGDAVAGIGALRDLGDRTGELKSMRTHPAFLRRGVASALLEHIVSVARERGMTRLSLETGSGPAFEPALALYRRRGFVDGEAFAQYRRSPFNQFLHLQL